MTKKLEKLENEKNRYSHGGKRMNSGRKTKIGSDPKDFEARDIFKKAYDRCITEEDYVKLINDSKKNLRLFPYYMDQRIGKAAQAVDVTSKGEQLEGLVIIKDNGDKTK